MTKGLGRSISRAPIGTEQAVRRLRFPVNVTITAAAAGAGVGFGTAVVGAMPEGNVLLLSAGGYFNFSSTSANITNAAFTGNFGVGSAVTAAGALTTTEQNIIASSAINAATAKVSNGNRGLFTTGGGASSFTNTTPVMINNVAKGVNLNLNIAITAGDFADASSAPVVCTGYVDLVFMVLGDN